MDGGGKVVFSQKAANDQAAIEQLITRVAKAAPRCGGRSI
ncbi:hypothetical protein [Saccharopolyspora sp. ASAGF58]